MWLLSLMVIGFCATYFRVKFIIFTLMILLWLVALTKFQGLGLLTTSLWIAALAFFIPANIPSLRQRFFSKPVCNKIRNMLPNISQTEQEALDAGTVGWEAELFSGRPDWKKLINQEPAILNEEEQAFIDGPIEQLCAMLDDWEITHELNDLPESVWSFIKEHKLFGMIIPKEYGGLGFTALAHSEVVMKLSSRSVTAAVTVMVPNSLGPAQLLLNYGTEEQKDYYLPRLASGEEIPCFALTGPEAGSDAGSLPDSGIVCKGEHNGETVLGIRLNWEKRYITLGPVATLLGLAFKLYDPEHLLGEQEELGITLALIPTNTPGITIGDRHFPMNVPFQNGPNWGENVFIPMDYLIGGMDYAGHGWRMLVECLSEGRGISLPALSTGSGKTVSRYSGAYARIRRQFKVPIGKFEGVEEPLARIAGYSYIMDASRRLTAQAVDHGERPAVASAIIKYHLTEKMRTVVNDAMDIQGGSAICMGPSNYLARAYMAIPIGITVEGANILTRSLIIFGQGAIRCHPHLLDEIEGARANSPAGLKQFDRALFSHMGYFLSNLSRTLWMSFTLSRFVKVPGRNVAKRYYQELTQLSAAYSLLSDVVMMSMGGSLKRRERLSARLGDVLSNLYMASAVLKHYEEEPDSNEENALLHYAMHETIYRAQQAMLAVYWNMPIRWLARLLRAISFPWGKPYSPPHDSIIHNAAQVLLSNNDARERLTSGIYITNHPEDRMGRMEHALQCVLAAEDADKQLSSARKVGIIQSHNMDEAIKEAKENKLLDDHDIELIQRAQEAVRNAIRVDHFAAGEL